MVCIQGPGEASKIYKFSKITFPEKCQDGAVPQKCSTVGNLFP